MLAIVPNVLIFRIGAKDEWKKVMGRLYVNIPHNKTERIIQYLVYFVFLTGIVFSVFLPLKLDTVWFYIGLLVFFTGRARIGIPKSQEKE